MNPKKLMLLLLVLISNFANAESIFKDNMQESISKNQPLINNENKTLEIKKQQERDTNNATGLALTENLEENLDYLYKTKFPISDYIYKGGFKKPLEDEIKLQEDINKDLEENQKQELNQEEFIRKIAEEKTKLQIKQQEILEEEKRLEAKRQENQMQKLIRDSILAERANTKIAVKEDISKYGADGFSNQKSVDISTNEHKLYRMIRAGRLIPAILTTAISSELQGIVTAQIEEDIFATHGRAVLIPRGSKAIGFYANETKIGQNRLQIEWREIITPQGINILLTNAIAGDNQGMSGAVGSINNRYWEKYGAAYALSTFSNVLLLSIASKIDNSGNIYAQEVYNQSKGDISSIVDEIVQQQGQLKPIIEIKQGSRIFIIPTNHIWFAKPKNNEILTQYFKNEF